MTDEEFLGKIEWQGGIWTGVEYGLKPTDLDGDSDLRKPWERIIAAVNSVGDDVALINEAIEKMNEDDDDDELTAEEEHARDTAELG